MDENKVLDIIERVAVELIVGCRGSPAAHRG
jgi:hypothetical protein